MCHLNILINSKKQIAETDTENILQFMSEIYVHNLTKNYRPANFHEQFGITKNVIGKLFNYLSVTGQCESKINILFVSAVYVSLGLNNLETSEIFKHVTKFTDQDIDEHEFSFSSIGNEFDFSIGIDEQVLAESSWPLEEQDLILDSSQNFY